MSREALIRYGRLTLQLYMIRCEGEPTSLPAEDAILVEMDQAFKEMNLIERTLVNKELANATKEVKKRLNKTGM